MRNRQEVNGPPCPKCGSADTVVTGTGGALTRTVLGGGLLEATGVVTANEGRLRYKCHDCHHAFVPDVEAAGPEMTTPFRVVLHRDRDFAGAVVPQMVYLNGAYVGNVANGQSIEFETTARTNTIVVTDHNGVAFKGGGCRFEATEGGSADIHVKRGRFTVAVAG
jgi:hypothetical protein